MGFQSNEFSTAAALPAASPNPALGLSKKYAFVAMSAPITEVSENAPSSVALVASRLYLSKMLIAAGDPISQCAMPFGTVGSGAGNVFLGVYERVGASLVLSQQTGNVASTFTAGGLAWGAAALQNQIAGGLAREIWMGVVSTLATAGPSVYITYSGLNAALTNPLGAVVAGFQDGNPTLPASVLVSALTQNTSELIMALA